MPRNAPRSIGRPSAAFRVRAGAGSPTLSSRKRKTSSRISPRSSGSSLRPPGNRGDGHVGAGRGEQPLGLLVDPAPEGESQDVPAGGDVLDPESAVGVEVDRVLPFSLLVGLALGGLVEAVVPGEDLLGRVVGEVVGLAGLGPDGRQVAVAQHEVGQREAPGDPEAADHRAAGAADLDPSRLSGAHLDEDGVGRGPAAIVRGVHVAVDRHQPGRDSLEDEPAGLVGEGVVIDPAGEPLVDHPGADLPLRGGLPADLQHSLDPAPGGEGHVGRAGELLGRAHGESGVVGHDDRDGLVLRAERVAAIRTGRHVGRLADHEIGLQPTVHDSHVILQAAERHPGTGQRLAVGPADDPRERGGLAELEVVGDLLGVVAEADQLGGEIAFGLDPDRALEALVREESAPEVDTGRCPGARCSNPDVATRHGRPGASGPQPGMSSKCSTGRPVAASVTVPCRCNGLCKVKVTSRGDVLNLRMIASSYPGFLASSTIDPVVGASCHSKRPWASVTHRQSNLPLPEKLVDSTTAPASGRPWESTTRPRNGRRSSSWITCAGMAVAASKVRECAARPGARTVSTTGDPCGSRQRPKRNWPVPSVSVRADIPLPVVCSATTEAPATGCPPGPTTLPVSDSPPFHRLHRVRARACSIEISRIAATWSG